MTIHADRGRWHTSRRRRFHGRVAIATIDAVIADVVLVAKLNWLLALDVLAGVPARAQNLSAHPERGQENEGGAENRRAREVVCADEISGASPQMKLSKR